jgi:hypothetical protein
MIKFNYNITYKEVTEESASMGDFSDTGFVSEDNEVECEEDELIDTVASLLRDYTEPSAFIVDDDCWFSTDPETDYSDGTERVESIHFSGLPAGTLAKAWASLK